MPKNSTTKKVEEEKEELENGDSTEAKPTETDSGDVDKAVHKSQQVVENGEVRIVTTLADGTVIKSIV